MKSSKIIIFSIAPLLLISLLLVPFISAQETGFYGTVKNVNGQPVVNVRVYAERWTGSYWEWTGYSYTNEFGSYTITGLSAGEYRLTAEHPDYVSSTIASITLNENEMKLVDFIFILPRAGKILVEIVNDLDEPINDVDIDVWGAGWSFPELIDNGKFLISPLVPGRYEVRCDPFAANLAEEKQTGITVSSGETEYIKFVLKPESVRGKLEGRITGLNNEPVENAVIQIFSDDTRWGRFLLSNDEGKYTITDIPSGKYVFIVSPPQDKIQSLATIAEVLYVDEDETLTKDISLIPAVVSGRISGLPSSLPAGTTGFYVIALPNIPLTKDNLLKEYLISSWKKWSCSVKPDGSYELLLPQGSFNIYLISCDENETFVTVHGKITNISVTTGQQLTGKDISATIGTASVSGAVSISEGSQYAPPLFSSPKAVLPPSSGGEKEDFIGTLVPFYSGRLNNCVVITDANHYPVGLATIIVSTQTPRTASYQIKNLTAGNYNMYVIPSMLSGYGCVEKQVSVSASHTENFSLDTKPAGIITGVIRNARDGTPVDSVRINALISGSDEIITTTATSSDGKYILTIATTGIYDLKLAKYWFGDKKQPRIFVYPERVTEQNLLLYFDISDEQKQKIYDFIEKLRVRIDTSTIATEIANLVVEIKLLEILPKLADWLTEAQIPVYLTEIGKVLDVCKDKIDFHKLVDIDTTTIVAEINKIIQKWNQEELTNIYYSLLDNTTFYFGGKPVHPWVMKQEGWKPNFVEFYTSASPESYTFDGLFPEGVPQKIIDILTPDLTPDFKLVLNSKVSQEQLEDYILNTVKPNCQTKLQTEPENPEANFILAVIEFYEFLKRHQETYSKIYTAISSGNIAGAYQIYISTDIENQLRKIKARLYKVKQAGHFWLTFVVSHELDENPFEINPTETEVTPYPIPAEIVNILISFVDCIEAIINSFSSLAKQFVEGPYIFDLDPNKLDFSTAKEPLDYINALRTANPDFLKLKTLEKDGVDGNAIMSKLKRQLILNAEIYKNTLNGLKLIVKSLAPEYGTYDRLSGFDKQIKYAEQVLDDLRNPAKYVVIDGKKVNISAWFDNPPTNMLDTIENYINGTDPTFGGLFITAGYGIVSGKVSVEEKGIKDALVKAIETTQNKEYSDLTDEDGFYLLTLPEGNYKLSISKTGYPTEEKNVSVISEEVVTVNFTLSPEKYSIKGRVVDN